MIKLQAGEVPRFVPGAEVPRTRRVRLRVLAEDGQGRKVALKLGDDRRGGALRDALRRDHDERSRNDQTDETPGEAVFFRPDGVRIDFLDMHEIDPSCAARPSAGRREAPNVVRVARPVEIDGRRGGDGVRARQELREKIRALEGIRLNWFLRRARRSRT